MCQLRCCVIDRMSEFILTLEYTFFHLMISISYDAYIRFIDRIFDSHNSRSLAPNLV